MDHQQHVRKSCITNSLCIIKKSVLAIKGNLRGKCVRFGLRNTKVTKLGHESRKPSKTKNHDSNNLKKSPTKDIQQLLKSCLLHKKKDKD